MVPTGNGERVELNRPQTPEDLEHPGGAALKRSRRREEVPGDEKPARGLAGDPHPKDASDPSVDPRPVLGTSFRVRRTSNRELGGRQEHFQAFGGFIGGGGFAVVDVPDEQTLNQMVIEMPFAWVSDVSVWLFVEGVTSFHQLQEAVAAMGAAR
jgi:hypothetical protein